MSVLSKTKNIFFLHIPKTAGASILSGMTRQFKTEEIHTTRSKTNWHSPYDDCISLKPEIENYYKFTVVRNPWDRTLSWFFFRKSILIEELSNVKNNKSVRIRNDIKSVNAELNAMQDFNEWLKQYHNIPWDYTWFSLSHSQSFWLGNGKFDKIIRFETLKNDIKDIPCMSHVELTHKHKSKNSAIDNTRLYNQYSIALIGDIYKLDIDRFNYRYE
jgi:hypothetical protein